MPERGSLLGKAERKGKRKKKPGRNPEEKPERHPEEKEPFWWLVWGTAA